MYFSYIKRAKYFHFVFLCFVGAALVKSAQAQTIDTVNAKKPKFDITKPLGNLYAAAPSVAFEQTRLVVYRPRLKVEQPGVISVHIDDRYHTSLQQDAFSVVCFEVTKVQLRSRLIDAEGSFQADLDAKQELALKRGESLYLRVSNGQEGHTRMEVVTSAVASQELSASREQKHTLSRVPQAQACQAAQDTVVTFGTQATFKAEETVLTSDGEKELLQIVNKINIKYKSSNNIKIHVVGYANDTSEESKNQRLSIERAQTVRTYFMSNGLQNMALTYEGRGSKLKETESTESATNVSGRHVEVAVAVGLH